MGSVHETPASGYRARMIVYAVLLLVLVGIIMVVAGVLSILSLRLSPGGAAAAATASPSSHKEPEPC